MDIFELAEATILTSTLASPCDSPKAIFIVGQSGSGKSSIAIPNKSNYIFINGDEFRGYYKDTLNLKNNDIYKYLEESGKVSSKIVEHLIKSLSDKKYNLIIEGTLRTSEVPIKTAELLVDKDYECSMIAIAMHPSESLLRTVNRYIALEYSHATDNRILPRPVDPKIHDNIVKSFGHNLQEAIDSKLFINIDLYSSQRIVYSSPAIEHIPISNIYKRTINQLSSKLEYKRIEREVKLTNTMVENLYSKPDIIPVMKKENLLKTMKYISKHLNKMKENIRGR